MTVPPKQELDAIDLIDPQPWRKELTDLRQRVAKLEALVDCLQAALSGDSIMTNVTKVSSTTEWKVGDKVHVASDAVADFTGVIAEIDSACGWVRVNRKLDASYWVRDYQLSRNE